MIDPLMFSELEFRQPKTTAIVLDTYQNPYTGILLEPKLPLVHQNKSPMSSIVRSLKGRGQGRGVAVGVTVRWESRGRGRSCGGDCSGSRGGGIRLPAYISSCNSWPINLSSGLICDPKRGYHVVKSFLFLSCTLNFRFLGLRLCL